MFLRGTKKKVEVGSTFLILWSRFFHLVETPSSTLWRLVENQRGPQATRRSPHKKGNHAHREAWCHNLMVTTGRIVRKFACAPFLFHLSYSPLNRQVYTYACKVPIFLFHEMYYRSKKCTRYFEIFYAWETKPFLSDVAKNDTQKLQMLHALRYALYVGSEI